MSDMRLSCRDMMNKIAWVRFSPALPQKWDLARGTGVLVR